MKALKNLLAVTFLALLICVPNVEAADDRPKVMLMDFRIFKDSVSSSKYIDTTMAKEFMISVLVNSRRFRVMESDSTLVQMLAEEYSEIKNSDLPDSAKEVDYLIYGDNFIEVTRKGEKFQSAKCTTILYLLDGKTERIITAVKGEGISKRSEVKKLGLSSQDILQALGIENAEKNLSKMLLIN